MIEIKLPTIDEMDISIIENSYIPELKGIYFIFDDSRNLVYIGISKNINKRIKAHLNNSKTSSSITNKDEIKKIALILWGDIPYSLEGIERIYIDLYKPKYNDIPINYNMPTIEEQREVMSRIALR